MQFELRKLLAAVVISATAAIAVPAGACTEADFAAAVDSAGDNLRAYNQQAAPKLQEKMTQLKSKKGWSDSDYQEKAFDYLRDDHLAEFDATANDLLIKIDTLGRPPEGKPLDCASLDELKAASVELLAVMKAKSAYTLAKIDAEFGAKTAAVSEPRKAEPPASVPASPPQPKPKAAAPSEVKPKSAELAAAPPAPVPHSGTDPAAWGTTTAHAPAAAAEPPPAGDSAAPDLFADTDEDGYTIEEIRDATRGFFGTISTNLAAVIEHSFRKSGRPTAYVLGQEGGGAFLAGLRYGDGTLYLRSGGSQKVYWHGPSLGYDFGAEGSRTLFLIYHLRQPDGLFRHFTGVDGSAYVVGGVGITFLKGGDVLMAPIRSGLGLRLGANIGYVRFTPRPTWNPF